MKYAIGQTVWYRSGIEIIKKKVTGCFLNAAIRYVLELENEGDPVFIKEEDLYPSREILIQAQIDYWASLKNEEKSTRSDDMSITSSLKNSEMVCDHEDNGALYTFHKPGHWESFCKRKCKKCGEFYR